MDNTHPLAPLEAHFVRSLQGDEQDFFPPIPTDYREVAGDNHDFSRGLMLAFPSIWVRMNTHQRLEAVYITACIERCIEIPAEVLRAKPAQQLEPLEQKQAPLSEVTGSAHFKTSRAERLRIFHFGSFDEVCGLMREVEEDVAIFMAARKQRLSNNLQRLADLKKQWGAATC